MSTTSLNKARWRRALSAGRSARGAGACLREPVRALVEHLGASTIASYNPTLLEPDPGISADFYPVLFEDGARAPFGAWGRPPLQQKRSGWPLEPAYTAPLASVDLVLVPALGVDEAGTRLGKGGGWYDRSLIDLHCPRFAVVHATEVIRGTALPAGPYDIPMDGWVTEEGFVLF